MRQIVLEEEEVFEVPDNVWCFDAETKRLIVSKRVKGKKKIVLVPKVAGG